VQKAELADFPLLQALTGVDSTYADPASACGHRPHLRSAETAESET
jgi:hypothetical protein